MIIDGALPINVDAMRVGHLILNSPTKNAMAIVTVRVDSVDVKLMVQRRSCHANRKANKKVATMPGITSGRPAWRNAVHREQPSIIAASSISFGIESKKPLVIHIQNGSAMVVKAMMRLVRVLYNPRDAMIRK